MTYCFPLCGNVAITVNEPMFVPLSEEVHIQDVHRFRRDVDLYPVEKEFVFTFKNQRHHLRLKRNNDIEIKTPVYVVRNGNIERQSIPNKKVKITVDSLKGGACLVSMNKMKNNPEKFRMSAREIGEGRRGAEWMGERKSPPPSSPHPSL